MSFVTTASDSSPLSAWHSAATSAVLPPPTGPPMPILSGPLGPAGSGAWVWAVIRSSRCKEGRLRSVVQFGQDVSQGVAVGGQPGGLVRGGRGPARDRRIGDDRFGGPPSRRGDRRDAQRVEA